VAFLFFINNQEGLEGRVLEKPPGEGFPAPQLRPQSGKSFCPCKMKKAKS